MDSIIFDLDGTLWDSREGVSNAWCEVLKNHDIERKVVTVEDLSKTMGMLLYDIGKLFMPEVEEKYRNSIVDECCHMEHVYLSEHGGKLYDKLEDTLNELSKKYKLFIVSNCQDGYIETFFKAHGLSKYFTDYECPGRTGKLKADNIKMIVERNHLKSPIYVGDTKWDMDSAHKAGVPFIYASYGFGKDLVGYEYKIERFEDLLKILSN